MAQKLKFGNGTWATKEGSTLAYNDENSNFKPLPFTTTRASSATRVNKEGLIEVVGNDKPRIDYTDSADGVLLLEPQSTNLVTYSEDFSQSSWIKENSTITSNTVISPDGTLNASKLTESAATGRIGLYQAKAGSSGTSHSFSFFAKYNTRQHISIVTSDTLSWNSQVVVDLINGTITKEFANGSYTVVNKVENYGNGWYKISSSLEGAFTGSVVYTRIYLSDIAVPSNPPSSYTGDGVSSAYIWGAQLEQDSYATSYIPTSGASATRVADTASGAGNSEVFNDSEGVLFADISALANDGTNRYISLSDGSTSNRVNIFFDSNNKLRGFYNGLSGSITISTDITLSNKIAFKYKSGDSSFWFNGFEVATRTDALSLSGLDSVSFDLGGGSDFYGKTKELGYYDTTLTDEELEYMTSYRSLSELVTELNLNTL